MSLVRIHAAPSLPVLLETSRAFLARLEAEGELERLPQACRGIRLRTGSDLMRWWLEFDHLASMCDATQSPPPAVFECRNAFAAAWDRALALGYKVDQDAQRAGRTSSSAQF